MLDSILGTLYIRFDRYDSKASRRSWYSSGSPYPTLQFSEICRLTVRYQFAKNRTSLSHQQSLPQNFIHVAAPMDDSKDKNARFRDLIDDSVGFNDNLPVLVIVGSGKLRWNMTALGHLGKAITCFANKSDHILSRHSK